MPMETLGMIIQLCNVTIGSYGRETIEAFQYDCRKYYINCYRDDRKTPSSSDILVDCILKKKDTK